MTHCLAELKVGEKAKILGFNPGNSTYRQKLLALGLVPEAILTLLRIAPFGDPLLIQINTSRLCLRKKESAILQLERLGNLT